jgi:pimeloyl-ACP methyl ester carboxylesterase
MICQQRRCARLSLWMLCLLTSLTAHGGETPFFVAEKPGPHPVGLRVVEQYDYSRSFRPLTDALGKPSRGESARPIQTLIWYPAAEAVESKPMTAGEYIDLSTTETRFGHPKPPSEGQAWWFEGWKQARPQPMLAVRDAPLAPGQFPLVVYAPSFSSWSWENADLCELIASYGYVVIAGPGMGVARQSTHDVAGTNAQAQDISFLIGYAHTLPDAEIAEVAVVGFSWGGLSNVFAAARDNRIKALVALDGSIRYFPGVVKQAGDVAPEKMTLPLLFFKGQASIEDQASLESRNNSGGPSVLNAWTHGDLISVNMLGFFHPEFLSMSQRNERLWQFDFPHWQTEADYGRADGITGYAWVARYTRKFLDAYLKHDSTALSFLKNEPASNGVPLHVMAVDFRGATPPPASFESFRTEVGREGFEHAAQVYASILKREPNFKLSDEALDSWTRELLEDEHSREAIDIAQLNVQLFPSGSSYGSLGEAYARSGRKDQAIDSYRKAIQRNPDNPYFKDRLGALQAEAAPRK